MSGAVFDINRVTWQTCSIVGDAADQFRPASTCHEWDDIYVKWVYLLMVSGF